MIFFSKLVRSVCSSKLSNRVLPPAMIENFGYLRRSEVLRLKHQHSLRKNVRAIPFASQATSLEDHTFFGDDFRFQHVSNKLA